MGSPLTMQATDCACSGRNAGGQHTSATAQPAVRSLTLAIRDLSGDDREA